MAKLELFSNLFRNDKYDATNKSVSAQIERGTRRAPHTPNFLSKVNQNIYFNFDNLDLF